MLKENHPKEVREKIIESARELFTTTGLKETTVRDIASASGTNMAMVNYYFHSKDKLFMAIFEEAFIVLSNKIFSAIDSNLPFFDMIRKWVDSYYETLMEYPQLPIFIINELSKNPHILEDKLMLKTPYQLYAKLAIYINEEEKKGAIRKISVSDFLLNLVSISVFPFVVRPVATKYLNIPDNQYKELLQSHKESVAEFIIHAITNKE
jgi:AcrR family transcriptional regulator